MLVKDAMESDDPSWALSKLNEEPPISVHAEFLRMAYAECETMRDHPEGTFVSIGLDKFIIFADEFGLKGRYRRSILRQLREVDNAKVRLENARLEEEREMARRNAK